MFRLLRQFFFSAIKNITKSKQAKKYANNYEVSFNREALRACEARALRARKTLKPRFTDFFTDFEKKNRLFCSLIANRIFR